MTYSMDVFIEQDMVLLWSSAAKVLDRERRVAAISYLWDGHSGERIAAILGELAG